ncbi:Hypothetical protein PHPALM_16913 [Phytophthora palmivora]|uniref:Uncharacterized protein n=1 Tax=Phytophthora palmivora TaxID=4796 RepID=A0A2P4XNK7_9STRA|nr:Hypothetical protein PHPALM_16913 [Phytophthora palmivora]
MKSDKSAGGSTRGKKKDTDKFDDVDKRIQIPVATRMKMQMNLKMNATEDTRLLRSGIDQYRTLQHLNTTTNTRRSRGSAERSVERGISLMERKQFASKKYKPAIEDLSRVMHMTPKSAELYAKRGKAYAALGEHHAAMLDYNEAISLAATQGAKVYKAMNNITHALEDLSHAENSAGGHRDLELFYQRAQLYLQCHQEPLALQDFDRFIELQEEAEESRHFDASGGVGGLAGFVAPQEMEAEPKARMLDVLLERAKLLQHMALEEDARERKDAELAAVEQGRSPKTGKNGSKLAYTEQFDAAEEDYEAILKSFANNMEAQLELQETLERKAAFEERKQREALAWLEQNADEIDGAGVLNANGNVTSSKSKKKKKKKKKKSNSSNTVNAG